MLMIHQNKRKMEMEKCSVAMGKRHFMFMALQDFSLIIEEEQVGFPDGDVKKIVALVLRFFTMLV